MVNTINFNWFSFMNTYKTKTVEKHFIKLATSFSPENIISCLQRYGVGHATMQQSKYTLTASHQRDRNNIKLMGN